MDNYQETLATSNQNTPQVTTDSSLNSDQIEVHPNSQEASPSTPEGPEDDQSSEQKTAPEAPPSTPEGPEDDQSSEQKTAPEAPPAKPEGPADGRQPFAPKAAPEAQTPTLEGPVDGQPSAQKATPEDQPSELMDPPGPTIIELQGRLNDIEKAKSDTRKKIQLRERNRDAALKCVIGLVKDHLSEAPAEVHLWIVALINLHVEGKDRRKTLDSLRDLGITDGFDTPKKRRKKSIKLGL